MLSQASEDSVLIFMADTLPKLLQEIHSIPTPNLLSSKLADIRSRITAILIADPSQNNYYSNHTGRELNRKLYNFGLSNDIVGEYDSGFRPKLKTIKEDPPAFFF